MNLKKQSIGYERTNILTDTNLITVHRLNNSEFMINANQIEIVEATPDTVITLVNEKKLIVKESAIEVRDKVVEYHRQVFTAAWNGYWKEGEQ